LYELLHDFAIAFDSIDELKLGTLEFDPVGWDSLVLGDVVSEILVWTRVEASRSVEAENARKLAASLRRLAVAMRRGRGRQGRGQGKATRKGRGRGKATRKGRGKGKAIRKGEGEGKANGKGRGKGKATGKAAVGDIVPQPAIASSAVDGDGSGAVDDTGLDEVAWMGDVMAEEAEIEEARAARTIPIPLPLDAGLGGASSPACFQTPLFNRFAHSAGPGSIC